MDIGKRISDLREARRLTTNRLANISGVSQSFLRDIELGKKQPTVEYLSYICYGLNITLSDFFKEDEEEELSLEISRMSVEQKKALLGFIKAMRLKDNGV